MSLENMIRNYNTEDLINAVLVISSDRDQILTDVHIPACELLASNIIRFNNKGGKTFTIDSYNELKQEACNIYSPSIDEIFRELQSYVNATDEKKQDFLKSTLMKVKSISFRGDAYQFQLMEVAERLYKPFDNDLESTYGFSFTLCEKVFMFIYKTYMNILSFSIKNMDKIEKIKTHAFKIPKEVLYKKFGKEEVDCLIKYLSIKPGSPNLKSVAINDFKPLYSKPFVDFESYIYMPIPVSTILNLPKIFHYTFIAEKKFNQDVVDRYTQNRGNVVEALAKEYFLRLFDVVHLSLKYPQDSKIYEADITAQSNNSTIFAEAKGKLLTLPALRGNLNAIKDDVYKAIGKAYEQSIRTIDHLNVGGTFIDEHENTVMLNNTTWKFPCCIMVENFTSIPSEIYNYLNLSSNKLIPYAVNIYDLDIVTRECSSQEEFIQYMIFRQMNIGKLATTDELDFFGYFKRYGLKQIEVEADEVWAVSYTEEFDKKYYALTMQWIADFEV